MFPVLTLLQRMQKLDILTKSKAPRFSSFWINLRQINLLFVFELFRFLFINFQYSLLLIMSVLLLLDKLIFLVKDKHKVKIQVKFLLIYYVKLLMIKYYNRNPHIISKMSSVKSINVYVLQNGKYVVKKKEEHTLFVTSTRSQKNDPSPQALRKQGVRNDQNLSEAPLKVNHHGNGDTSGSVDFSRKSGYIPKYFTSRKVSLELDPYEISPVKVEHIVHHHTPIKTPAIAFKLPIENLSNACSEPDEVFYSPRENHRDRHQDTQILRIKDKQIAALNKKIEQLTKINKSIGQKLKTKKIDSESKGLLDLSWYQSALADRTHQVEVLRKENERCHQIRKQFGERNERLQKVHRQLCQSILKLKGQIFSFQDLQQLFGNSDAIKSNDMLLSLQSQAESISSQLRNSQIIDNQSQQSKNIVEQLKNELKLQKMFLEAFKNGLDKKYQVKNMFKCLIESNKINKTLSKQQSNEIKTQLQIRDGLKKIINQLQQSTQNNTCKCKLSEIINSFNKKFNSLLVSSSTQGQTRNKWIKETIKSNKVEVQLKNMFLRLLKGKIEERKTQQTLSNGLSESQSQQIQLNNLIIEAQLIQESINSLLADTKTKQGQILRSMPQLNGVERRFPNESCEQEPTVNTSLQIALPTVKSSKSLKFNEKRIVGYSGLSIISIRHS